MLSSGWLVFRTVGQSEAITRGVAEFGGVHKVRKISANHTPPFSHPTQFFFFFFFSTTNIHHQFPNTENFFSLSFFSSFSLSRVPLLAQCYLTFRVTEHR